MNLVVAQLEPQNAVRVMTPAFDLVNLVEQVEKFGLFFFVGAAAGGQRHFRVVGYLFEQAATDEERFVVRCAGVKDGCPIKGEIL